MGECLFCDRAQHDLIAEGRYAYLRHDNYPATPGHMEVVPWRHVVSLFDLNAAEREEMWSLMHYATQGLKSQHRPDGWNVGVNDGRAAGRSVDHVHVHLIPRRWGDVPDLRGGIRRVVESEPFDPAAWEAAHTAPQQPQEPRNPQTHTRTTPTPENPAAGATGPHGRHA
ncbi:HIT family protein [Streptomonospora nanhaiensis]|uniref:HIT family protein n=1 Tax=Streptomonospora nanhaiensis TaxID=1323731 RepID=UPI001C3849E8|nr:HIT domain-containing protein [Streptomonospora nanhaiensis]MBV2364283.1 HIT domain-containing protein [Streptomonospora nanhaiensis]